MLNLNLKPETLTAFRAVIESAVDTVAQRLGDEHRHKGVYARLYVLRSHQPPAGNLLQIFGAWVGGNSNIKKSSRCRELSKEKGFRLAESFIDNNESISSYETRDEARNQWGGAILLDCWVREFNPGPSHLIFTCSGLPELGDEAAMLLTSTNMPWGVGLREIQDIVQVSKNGLACELLGLRPPS